MWTYKGEQLTDQVAAEYWGFVYLITNLTNDKKYIGKKQFQFERRKKVKGRKNRKKITVDSDWKTYYGSNDQLKQDVEDLGEDNFTREILYLCSNKSECSYLEAYEQMVRHVLLNENYYNSWISVRIQQKGLDKLCLS